MFFSFLSRKTNLPKKLLKSPTGMMGVAVAINSDSEFSGSYFNLCTLRPGKPAGFIRLILNF